MAAAKDKVDRLLDLARRRSAFERAIHVLSEAKKAIRESRREVRRTVGEPSYSTNRMKCVEVEIDAAVRGLRCARGNTSRAIANAARASGKGGE